MRLPLVFCTYQALLRWLWIMDADPSPCLLHVVLRSAVDYGCGSYSYMFAKE
jgi:hypothetical protein